MIKKNNDLVYADLMMSVDQETCFNIIESCKTEDYKRGHAPNAWKKICGRFEKKDELHHQDLLRTMLTNKLQISQKPDDWINEMEKTRFDLKQLHNDLSYDEDIKFIKHLLLLIPTSEYSTIYWQILHQLEENALTYDKFKHQLRAFYEREIEFKRDRLNYKKDRVLKVVNNPIRKPIINGETPRRFNYQQTKNKKCPWCYSPNHTLSECNYAKDNDTSIYRCSKCTQPYHNDENCHSKQQKMKKDHKNVTSQNILMATEVKCVDNDIGKT